MALCWSGRTVSVTCACYRRCSCCADNTCAAMGCSRPRNSSVPAHTPSCTPWASRTSRTAVYRQGCRSPCRPLWSSLHAPHNQSRVSNKCIAVRKVATPLRELTCHMGSHSRQRWHSRPYPSRSWYSIKQPRRDARLSWPSWLVTYRDGIPARRRSPIQVLTGPDVR